MNDRIHLPLLWLAISAIAVWTTSMSWPAAHLGEEILPVGNDAFYHARRILDVAYDRTELYQFDSRIHAPEGSLVTWPWAFDYLLGMLARVALHFGLVTDPMQLVAWIPVAAAPISIALMLVIARQLGMPLSFAALAGLCVALAPLTQYLHGVGIIDHHFAEYIFVLAALGAGLWWLRKPDEWRGAAALGVVLGAAPAIHTSLFILQVPVLIAMFIGWLTRNPLPRARSIAFGVTLFVTCLLVALPSLPLRLGRFEFYTLSWFHVYVSAGTAIAAVLMSSPLSKRNIWILLTAALALTAPLAGQLIASTSFLAGSSTRLNEIFEMRSLLRQLGEPNGARNVSNLYSAFALLLPATLALCLWQAWRQRREPSLLYFYISCAFGLCMLTLQFRLHYFGSYALYLPWLVLATDVLQPHPERRKQITLATVFAFVLLYYYPLRYQLWAPWTPANDHSFVNLRPVLEQLKHECNRHPGTVLADSDAGHYIRYYTECSVIANNFLLTPQHGQKIAESERLMSLRATQLIEDPADVTYILARPLGIVRLSPTELEYHYFGGQTEGLATDLLFSAPESLPHEYELLWTVTLPKLDNAPYARLFRVNRHLPSRATPSP